MAVVEPLERSAQLGSLLLRWQEARQLGQSVSAEELCGECPELATELRQQIAAFESMQALLGVGPNPVTTAEVASADAPILPGLDPHAITGYELLGVLGQGGMGVVYRARQLRPRRLVALKLCLAGTQATPEQFARFRNEAEAAAGLRHPNIVQIHEVGDQNGQPYLVMELVEGGNLAQRLAESVMPARDAAEILRVLVEATAAAHEQGIIHRDLKPGNILLALRGEPEAMPLRPIASGFSVNGCVPKITDFGLAKRLHADSAANSGGWHTRTGSVLGTASYMAPEQAEGQGEKVGPLVDVYALGAILYEMLTGRPPFKGETLLDTLQQVRSQEPVPPHRLRPAVPRDLETICLKCLEKEPARRYPSARALAEDLRRFLAREPILARPASVTEKAVKWARRKPAVAALLLVSLLAAGSLLGGWGWFTLALHREREAAHQARLHALEQELIARLEREQARTHWAAAVQQRNRAEALLAQTCSAVEEHALAIKSAKGEAGAVPGGILYALARIYARNAAGVGQLSELPTEDRRHLGELYAARAVKLLASAAALEYFHNPARLARLQQDPELSCLRERADFNQLVQELTTGTGRPLRGGE